MATTILDNVPRHFSATMQTRYKNAYRRRLMDRSIMDDILNGNPENIKGFLGSGKGLKVELYIPDNVKIRDTQPDGDIIYQELTDTTETFGLPYESYWAVKFRPEDIAFNPMDPRSDAFTNATDQMARHIEKKWGADALNKVPSYNKGHAAGITYGNFDLGDVGDGDAVVLYKTQAQVDAATGVAHREVGADFIIRLADTIRQNEGLSGSHITVIMPSPVKHLLKTSELKYEGFMGRNAALGSDIRGGRDGRAEVRFLGTMDDTITVVQNNIMFPARTYMSGSKKHTVYPVYALSRDAYAYISDTVFKDTAMKDIGNWDDHSRAKQVYGWPLLFPQMTAVAYVEIAEPAYSAS
jgi:hypothetical protein